MCPALLFFCCLPPRPTSRADGGVKAGGRSELTRTAPGQYKGAYTDTVVKEKGPGKIDLKWSRIKAPLQWHLAGDNRFGDLSIRLIDKEIRRPH